MMHNIAAFGSSANFSNTMGRDATDLCDALLHTQGAYLVAERWFIGHMLTNDAKTAGLYFPRRGMPFGLQFHDPTR
jgi:hypothetical protein